MENQSQSSYDIIRLEAAGLYTLSFFGYILHLVLHNTMSHGMDPAKLSEAAAMMTKPSVLTMFFVWNILTILPAVLAFVLKGRKSWWFIAILSTLIFLANAAHSIAHLNQGDIFNGGNTLVIQCVPMLWALVLSFKLARNLEE